MRIAVISDIHSNYHALTAVLDNTDEAKVDAIWCLGDVFGYGPLPQQCWNALTDRLEPQKGHWVAGNHDWGFIRKLDAVYVQIAGHGAIVGDFNPAALDMLEKQRQALAHDLDLASAVHDLPLFTSPLPGVYLVHGGVYPDAVDAIGQYLRLAEHASRTLAHLYQFVANPDAPNWTVPRVAAGGWHPPELVLVGHTHVASCLRLQSFNASDDGLTRWEDLTPQLDQGPIVLDDVSRYPVIANPGSVGFARDQPGRACYLLLDWQPNRIALTLRRIPYDIAATCREMKAIHAPESLFRSLGHSC